MYKNLGKAKIIRKENKLFDIEFYSEMLGPPGTKGEFLLSPVFGDQTDEDVMNKLNDTSLREFKVTASLSKRIEFDRKIEGSINVEDGDSFWLAKDEVLSSKLKTKVGIYRLFINKNNEISKIEYKCKTTSIVKAQNLFFSGITPLLDVISYKAGIPLIISRIICMDIKHAISSIIYESPHKPIAIPPFTETLIGEMFPIYALYREAKVNTSSYYKFLCFYKILEGIFSKLRPQLMKHAKDLGINLKCKKEVVPNHYLIREYNEDFIGIKIKKLFDDVLTKQFRDAVAHFVLRDGTLLNLTDYNTNRKFSSVLFLTEFCCRIVIDNQINLFYKFYSNKKNEKS